MLECPCLLLWKCLMCVCMHDEVLEYLAGKSRSAVNTYGVFQSIWDLFRFPIGSGGLDTFSFSF